MGRPCTICISPERRRIEEDVAAGVGYRRISKRYGVSIAGISRHLKAHVAAELMEQLRERAEALEERELSEFLGPQLVEWIHAEDAKQEEMLDLIEEGVEDCNLESYERRLT